MAILLYAGSVSWLTLQSHRLPVIPRMEEALYDAFQRYRTIDNDSELGDQELSRVLKRTVLVDLGEKSLDKETGRVDRRVLVKLVNFLARRGEQAHFAVFLDYFFDREAGEGTALRRALERIGPRLVLPYRLNTHARPEFYRKQLPTEVSDNRKNLAYRPPRIGYANTFALNDGEKVRFVPLRFNDSTESCVLALASLTHPESTKRMERAYSSPWLEVNYLFRNEGGMRTQEFPAKRIHTIDDLLADTLGLFTSIDWYNTDLVFVGLFSSFSNIYGRNIDRMATPVAEDLSGAMVLFNAYLNVITETYFRQADGWLILWINTIATLMGLLYAAITSGQGRVPSTWQTVGEAILPPALSLGLLWFGYAHFHLKIPFVVPAIALILQLRAVIVFIHLILKSKP